MAMHSKMFQISDGLDDALGEYAAAHNEAAAQVIRKAIAAFIGYDLANEPKDERRNRVYANEEDRRKAQAARNKRRNQIRADLVKEYEGQRREEIITKLLEDLANVGKEPDEPTTSSPSSDDVLDQDDILSLDDEDLE